MTKDVPSFKQEKPMHKPKRYSRKAYTVWFLTLANYPADNDVVDLYLKKCWQNRSIKNFKNLALSEEGVKFLTKTLKLESYQVHSTGKGILISPEFAHYIDCNMQHPYYFDGKEFITFSVDDYIASSIIYYGAKIHGAIPFMASNRPWDKTQHRQVFGRSGKIVLKHKF